MELIKRLLYKDREFYINAAPRDVNMLISEEEFAKGLGLDLEQGARLVRNEVETVVTHWRGVTAAVILQSLP